MAIRLLKENLKPNSKSRTKRRTEMKEKAEFAFWPHGKQFEPVCEDAVVVNELPQVGQPTEYGKITSVSRINIDERLSDNKFDFYLVVIDNDEAGITDVDFLAKRH